MKKIIISLMCLILIFSGCAKKEEAKKPEDQVPKQPEVLSSLEQDILTLMGKIDLTPSINNALEEKKKNEEIAQQKEFIIAKESEDRLSEQDRPKTSEEKEAKSVKISGFTENAIIYNMLKSENIKAITELESEDVPSKLEESWMSIKKDLVKIHKSWNDLESKMADVPVGKESIESFENNLTLLTDSINKYDIFNSLVYANNLTKYTSEFKNYFKSPTNNDTDKMTYSIRKAALLTSLGNFDEAVSTVNATLETIDSKSSTIMQKDKEAFLKLKNSLDDLKKSIETKDLKLMNIKAPIVIENINTLKDIK